MEAIEIASHVEFFAKACTAIVEVLETGRYRVKTNRESLQSHSLVAYYFGHCEKSNFFFSDGIGTLHFALAERFDAEFARSCKASKTTRSISSQGAGLPVQISNWRAAWWTNISIPGMI
jgi:hypothetical protein